MRESRERWAAIAALAAACVLGLAGCAVGEEPRPAAPESSASAAPAPVEEEPAESEQAEGESSDAAPAPGAYIDFEDGVIERTDGEKVLFFHAPWCPNCRQLDEQLLAEGVPAGLTVIKVDYDSRNDLRQQYGVTLQTTVVFVDDSGLPLASSVLYDDPSIEALLAARP